MCFCALGSVGLGDGRTHTGPDLVGSGILAGSSALSCFPAVPAPDPPSPPLSVPWGCAEGGEGIGPWAQMLKFFSVSPVTAEPQPADRGAGPPGCHHPQADRCHYRSRPERQPVPGAGAQVPGERGWCEGRAGHFESSCGCLAVCSPEVALPLPRLGLVVRHLPARASA